MLWMGSLTNYKVSNHHISLPSFSHLLFTLQITKSTQVFSCFNMFVLLLHIQFSSHPICQEYQSHNIFLFPKGTPKGTSFLKEATSPLKGTTQQLQNKQSSKHLPVPYDFSRLCSVKALSGDPRRLKLHWCILPCPTTCAQALLLAIEKLF